MAKSLGYDQLLQLAVAEGATSPNPGATGTLAWSTTTSRVVAWDGSKWNSGWLNYILQLAVAEGATSPSPGVTGAIAWSTSLSKLVAWNGTTWNAVDTAGGGGGSGDVVGPSSSTDSRVVVFDSTSGKVIKEAVYLDIPDTSTPVAPSAGNLRLFTRSQAGRQLLALIGPSGIDTNLQPALFRNSVHMWLPGTGTTTSIAFGTNWTARNSGTSAAQAHPTRTATNALTSLNRATFNTGTTATGTSGIQSGQLVAWRGNATGLGGFFYFSRFGIETYRSDIQAWTGLASGNAALAGEPSSLLHSCGICKDSTDTNWFIFTKDSTNKTRIDTGLAVSAGTILDFMMFCPPNSNSIKFRLVNAVTGAVIVDDASISTTLPASSTFMYAHTAIRSTVGTTAASLALNRIYVEADL